MFDYDMCRTVVSQAGGMRSQIIHAGQLCHCDLMAAQW